MRRFALLGAMLCSLATPASAQSSFYQICQTDQSCMDAYGPGHSVDPNNCTRCVGTEDNVVTDTSGDSGSSGSPPVLRTRPPVQQQRPPGVDLRLRNTLTVGNLAVAPLPPAGPTATPARLRCGAIAADGVVSRAERSEWDELNCAQYSAR